MNAHAPGLVLEFALALIDEASAPPALDFDGTARVRHRDVDGRSVYVEIELS